MINLKTLKAGNKVKFTGFVAEQIASINTVKPSSHLDINKIYTIKSFAVHHFHTTIMLIEVEGEFGADSFIDM